MSQNKSIDYKSVMLCSLKGLLAAVIVSAALSLILSAVMTALPGPADYITPMAYITLFLSFIIGGVFSSLGAESPFVSSVIYSAFHLGLILLSLLIFGGNSTLGIIMRLLMCSGAVICSLLSSFAFTKNRNGKRKTMSRSKRYRM